MITLPVEAASSVETVPVSVAATGAAFAATAVTVHAFDVRVQTGSVASPVTAGASGAAYPVNAGAIERIVPDPYTGEYEVTPSEETQILQTMNKNMTQNVTINPIPSDYGRITWNGSVLTVS